MIEAFNIENLFLCQTDSNLRAICFAKDNAGKIFVKIEKIAKILWLFSEFCGKLITSMLCAYKAGLKLEDVIHG